MNNFSFLCQSIIVVENQLWYENIWLRQLISTPIYWVEINVMPDLPKFVSLTLIWESDDYLLACLDWYLSKDHLRSNSSSTWEPIRSTHFQVLSQIKSIRNSCSNAQWSLYRQGTKTFQVLLMHMKMCEPLVVTGVIRKSCTVALHYMVHFHLRETMDINDIESIRIIKM